MTRLVVLGAGGMLGQPWLDAFLNVIPSLQRVLK